MELIPLLLYPLFIFVIFKYLKSLTQKDKNAIHKFLGREYPDLVIEEIELMNYSNVDLRDSFCYPIPRFYSVTVKLSDSQEAKSIMIRRTRSGEISVVPTLIQKEADRSRGIKF